MAVIVVVERHSYIFFSFSSLLFATLPLCGVEIVDGVRNFLCDAFIWLDEKVEFTNFHFFFGPLCSIVYRTNGLGYN